MSPPKTVPLTMSPKLRFAPADGNTYGPEDKDRVFAQQPIESLSLPAYLVPSPSTDLKPPTLVYGWRLGHEKLMQVALDHFPQAVHYLAAPATLGLGDEEDEDYTEEDWTHKRPNIADTIFDYDFIEAMLNYLGIGPEGDEMLTVTVLYDSQREGDWGLTVGSNYLKLLKKEYVQKLEALIKPEEPAKWYLDCDKWMWRRLPLRAKRQTKPKRAKGKSVVPAGTTVVASNEVVQPVS